MTDGSGAGASSAIVFDLDGTLLRPERDYGDLLAGAFEAVAGEVRAAWVERYNESFFRLFDACEPAPYRRAFEAVGAGLDAAALVAALREREVAACRPTEGVARDLARLTADHRLGVLTNGVRDWQLRKLRAHGLEQYFDAVVASYEAGAHKPAPAPFALAEQRLQADRYVIVGDDDADIDGGERAGWATHRYRGDGFGALPDALAWP